MSWIKVRVNVDAAQTEALENVLTALGATSVELADAGDEPILEPQPGETPLWSRIRLTALFEPDVDETGIRLAIASVTEPGARSSVTFGVVDQEDWVGKLRDELTPLRFGRNLWVCPPGRDCPDPDATVIVMEPGLAFGTGSHATTSLCLDWLADHPPADQKVLDFGCGSGILSVASLALRARQVTAVDIDAQALTATRDNAQRNNGDARLTVLPPGDLERSGDYDVVVANILSGTLIELAPVLRMYCRTGTRLALSGILTEQAGSVADAYREWCPMTDAAQRDGWVLLTGIVE